MSAALLPLLHALATPSPCPNAASRRHCIVNCSGQDVKPSVLEAFVDGFNLVDLNMKISAAQRVCVHVHGHLFCVHVESGCLCVCLCMRL